MTLTPTKRVKDAVYAICLTCRVQIEENQYWDFSKTLALHRSGKRGDHRITLYAIKAD